MNELISFAILSFTIFITIINPLSTLPTFLIMTVPLNDAQRRQMG